jgi:hypothetical protein
LYQFELAKKGSGNHAKHGKNWNANDHAHDSAELGGGQRDEKYFERVGLNAFRHDKRADEVVVNDLYYDKTLP